MYKIKEMRGWVIALVAMVLVLDQALKVWVKLNFSLGEEVSIFGDWFKLHFVENPGMAFGLEMGGSMGKVLLSVFRLAAIGGLGYYIHYLIKKGMPKGFILSIALIFAGAIGNILDCAFYGVLFDKGTVYNMDMQTYLSYSGLATIGGGYAPMLQGCVVDMLSFPLVEGTYPEWMPWVGGDSFMFFRPVFNIADSAVTIGVLILLIFYFKQFKK